MSASRKDHTGRKAVLGCSAGMAVLLGAVSLGVIAYTAGVIAVRTSTGFRSATAAIEAREHAHPTLGLPIHHGYWLGIQFARDASDALALEVRSTSTGTLGGATVYSTFTIDSAGLTPTSVLITAPGGVIDVLADNERASIAQEEARNRSLLEEARTLHERDRNAEALLIINEAVELDSRHPTALALRCQIRLGLNDPSGAMEDATNALQIQADHGEALRSLAQVHGYNEDWDRCIGVSTERIRTDPRDGDAWAIRADCFRGAGKRREALAGAREACELDSNDGCQLAARLE